MWVMIEMEFVMLVAAVACFAYAQYQEKTQRATEEREKANFHNNYKLMFGEDLNNQYEMSDVSRSRAESAGDYIQHSGIN